MQNNIFSTKQSYPQGHLHGHVFTFYRRATLLLRVMKFSLTDLIVDTNICPVYQPCVNLFSAIHFYERNDKTEKLFTFQNMPPLYLQSQGNNRKRDYKKMTTIRP